MFVCHGNICRSPMAEFYFKKILGEEGMTSEIYVDSSAVSPEEEGNPVYPPVRRMLSAIGIDTGSKRAKTLQRSDYSKYDLFIGMDSSNMRGIMRIFGSDPNKKVKKLLDYTDCGGDVADPYYFGNYDKTFDDVKRGCEALLDLLKAENVAK